MFDTLTLTSANAPSRQLQTQTSAQRTPTELPATEAENQPIMHQDIESIEHPPKTGTQGTTPRLLLG